MSKFQSSSRVFCETTVFVVNYTEYLQSETWKHRRATFFQRSDRVLRMRRQYGQIVCEFCKSDKKFNLHHKTYERLGHERSTDLIILCDNCHDTVHAISTEVGVESATRRIRKIWLAK